MFDIAVKNLSTSVADADLASALPAFQEQVSRDLAPAWGVDCRLRIAAKDEHLVEGEWLIGLFDTSDEAGALGYHDVTNSGAPLGKVFVGTTIKYGGLWTVTFSHELLEMLVDPEINLCVQTGNRLYAYEVCDPCEADELGYKIGDTVVSDFVLPSWFEEGTGVKGFRSFNGAAANLTKPFTLAPGGYCSYLDFNSPGGWQQLQERRADGAEQKPHGLSRQPRRGKTRLARVHSVG